MKVVTWNVNGLRAVLKNQGKDLRSFLDCLNADIICLQETKATRDQLDSTTYSAQGYNAYFSFSRAKTGYSGVVTFCCESVTPLRAEEGLSGVFLERREDGVGCYCESPVTLSPELQTLDNEGRCVMTEHALEEFGSGLGSSLVVLNLYCPRVDADNQSRLEYQHKFYTALMERCMAMKNAGKHVIVVGDFNCSIQPIDSAYAQDDPTLLDTPSRKYFLQFVQSELCTGPQSSPHPSTQTHPPPTNSDAPLRLLDVFRCLHPDVQGAFSWWHTVTDSRKVNYGKRIDLILCSSSLGGCVVSSEVCQGIMGSDHCPVNASFSLTLGKAPKPPTLCSKYFVEFSGKQQTLSSLWSSLPPRNASPLKRTDCSSHGNDSHGDSTPVTKKKKDSKSSAGKSLASFFKPHCGNGDEEQGSLRGPPKSSQDGVVEMDSFCEAPKPLSSEWKSVFSAPKQVLCTGHEEPCVLRTAKKQGPNFNRQFYCCARPGGFKGDANARCNFFMWTTKLRKT
eukprot:Em0001g3723a